MTSFHLKCYLLPPPLDSGWREAQPSPWGNQVYSAKFWGIVTSLGSKLANSIWAEGKIWPGQCPLSYSPPRNLWLRLHPQQGSHQPQHAGLPAHRCGSPVPGESLSVWQLTTYHTSGLDYLVKFSAIWSVVRTPSPMRSEPCLGERNHISNLFF